MAAVASAAGDSAGGEGLVSTLADAVVVVETDELEAALDAGGDVVGAADVGVAFVEVGASEVDAGAFEVSRPPGA